MSKDHSTPPRLTLTRRSLLPAAAALLASRGVEAAETSLPPELVQAAAGLEPYLFPQDRFGDVSRGNPVPHTLSEARRAEVGLTRDTWKLDVISDPEHPATLGRQFTQARGDALDFRSLLQLGEKHAVRFPKVMTCLNIGCPLGMGIWEGVPLREVIWLTSPRENLRRVFFYGFHNNDPKQRFQSSLPIGRVLEDPLGTPPVILCYKLNGQWLDPKRGGPVRVVVPEAYGFKNVKWLTHLLLTNLSHANDTYAAQNNDIDSPLKTFAATLSLPTEPRAHTPLTVTGYAQVGVSGLSKVQTWVQRGDATWPVDDPHFLRAPWADARILPPPAQWGGDLPGGEIPAGTLGFDPMTGRPASWPMRLCKAHWATVLPGLPAGEYTLRCRTIDENGIAQPMPRPFRKSGHTAIESVAIRVVG